MGYARVIHKEKKRKVEKKMDKCPRYLKQWVHRCPPEREREINKIPYVFLQMFLSFKREISFQGA